MKKIWHRWLAGLTSATLLLSQGSTALAVQPTMVENQAAPALVLAPPPPGYLTGPAAGDAYDIALAYLRANRAQYGLTTDDLADLSVARRYTSAHNGLTHLYLVQRWQGIEVFNGVFNFNIDQHGRILSVGNRLVPNLAGRVNTTKATLTAVQAAEKAAAFNGLALTAPLTVLDFATAPDQGTLLSKGGVSQEDIAAKLVYDASGKAPRLAWNIIIYTLDSDHWWNTRVDAVTGEVISQNDWVIHEHFEAQAAEAAATAAAKAGVAPATNAAWAPVPAPATLALSFPITPVADGSSYQVYPWPVESPIHTTPLPPADGRITVTQPADALGSPFGWHDTNGAAGAESTLTIGNNTQAYLDLGNDNTPSIPGDFPADGGAGLDFIFPLDLTQAPSAYRPAAVTNLFYWNNLMHDIPYRYGFDEASGNFQENNYGRGGLGSDSVNAEAQDGGGTNNANFATPADGQNPRMQMYLWTTTTPGRDGDLDNGIIAHEYGHGISNRLTGTGPGCLTGSEQMGEGWSDWQSIFMTMGASENFVVGRGIGTYALGQATTGVGIRPAKYSTDLGVNDFTYQDTRTLAVPHGVGFMWNTMLYEMTAALVDKYGINPDLYGAWNTGGNNLAYQLVTDGMKIQPCNPGFVDGRDAILAADMALTGGANQCTIWTAFAKRGLGFSAIQGSSSTNSDNTEAFNMPPGCLFLSTNTPVQNICQGETAAYVIQVGQAFSVPVNMSATGNPAPTTAVFSPNPVMTLPSTTTLTIGNTAAAPAGNYTVTVQATDVNTSSTTPVTLNIYAGTPALPTLTSPANGANNQPLNVPLAWTAVSGTAGYDVQVATDAGFTNIVYSATVSGANTTVMGLSGNTTYHWRTRASNPCGSSAFTAAFSFSTVPVFCATPNLAIPDNTVAGVTSTMNIVPTGQLLDLNISISGTHSWVGDLIFTVTHQSTAISIVDRPGRTTTGNGCANNNFVPELDDEGPDGPVENQCATNPALFGRPTPNDALSAFDGHDFSGVWSLQVSDRAGADVGVLQEWCLVPTYANTTPVAEIALHKTVGTDPTQCAATDSISVGYDTEVTYCYTVENTGDITLTTHTLTDTHLGGILSNMAYSLAPGATAFVTESVNLTQTTVNTGLWTATATTYTASASDMATVTVAPAQPEIVVHKTVGIDPTQCAATDSINVAYDTEVTYCYTVENTGNITLTTHTLTDTHLGGILSNYPFTLTPGASAYITASVNLTQTTMNTGYWTATAMPHTAWASDMATVTVAPALPEIGLQLPNMAVTQPANNVTTRTVLIGNNGHASTSLTWNIVEETALQVGAKSILGYPVVAGGCTATDLPWVSATPVSGTTAGGATTSVAVVYNSTGLLPGLYTGNLCINNNDATNPQVDVPVTLTVQPTFGVTVSVSTQAQSSPVGQVVTYTFIVTNTGDYTDTYDMGLSNAPVFSTTAPATVGPLAPGASAMVYVTVQIPAGATEGQISAANIFVTSQGSASATFSGTLTTTANWYKNYGAYIRR